MILAKGAYIRSYIVQCVTQIIWNIHSTSQLEHQLTTSSSSLVFDKLYIGLVSAINTCQPNPDSML